MFGCVDTVGPQAGDIAGTAWLAAGLPESVPGVTVDRQCGSSQQAVHFAAQAVLSGTADLVVAGGVQNMSMIPIAAAMVHANGDPFSGSAGCRPGTGQDISQFRAPAGSREVGISRARWSCTPSTATPTRYAAIDSGQFVAEIAPYGGLAEDEGPRRDTSREKMAALRPLRENGRIPAARPARCRCFRLLADRVGGGSEARPETARPYQSPVRPRRRSGMDADRADPGDSNGRSGPG